MHIFLNYYYHHHQLHVDIHATMGPPNGAEHAKPKPIVMLIKKDVQAPAGEEEPPRLLEDPGEYV